MDGADETLVYAVNHKFDPKAHKIVSLAPVPRSVRLWWLKFWKKILESKRFINTVRDDRRPSLDGSHKDLRARAAMQSIIPTSSGVSKTITKLYPHLKAKFRVGFEGAGLNPSGRVYLPTGKKTTAEL